MRGQASLQYGPQFGGMVNYILKNGAEIKKPFQYETNQAVGSNGMLNTYNAVGGDTRKFHYYAYIDHRNSEGWRANSRYYTNAGFVTFTYKINERFSVTSEVMHSHINSQQPGGLTDAEVQSDARMSHRSRNWIDIKWNTAALIGNYFFNEKKNTRLNVKLFGVLADRANIGNVMPITIKDSINPATLQFNNRQSDRDLYFNLGSELRFLTDYSLFGHKNTISAGIRFFRGNTSRSRLGVGDNGTTFNTNFIVKNQDLDLITNNSAAFVENIFRLGNRLLVIPGIRYENLSMMAEGRLSYSSSGEENLIAPANRKRNLLLPGIGAEYKINELTRIYTNYSKAYRPMLFYDVTVLPSIEVVDPGLKDSKGYNLDIGCKGKIDEYLIFDLSVYHLQYNKRIGVIKQQSQEGSFYNYRTNVGNSSTNGVEGLVEISPLAFSGKRPIVNLRMFATYSYTDARYEDFKVITLDNKIGRAHV